MSFYKTLFFLFSSICEKNGCSNNWSCLEHPLEESDLKPHSKNIVAGLNSWCNQNFSLGFRMTNVNSRSQNAAEVKG